MAGRLRHPDKDLDRVLRAAARQGWRVTRKGGYFKMYCPCDQQHWKTVHLSPSNPLYRTQLIGWLRRNTCWNEER